MADDISIFVKVVGKEDIVAATTSLNKLESGVKRLSGDLSKGRINGDQYSTGLKELRRGVDSSFSSWQKAKTAVDQYSKELLKVNTVQTQAKAAIAAETMALKAYRQARREAMEENRRFDTQARVSAQTALLAAKAARTQADANRKLRFEFRDGYAAAVKLRAEQMRLSQAHRKGIIDADQLTAAQGRLGNSAVVGGRRMNSTGMLIQQAGYQFGDFAVQVQGGTNPMVAFGQQATQMIGAFNLLPAATLRASVGVGVFKVSVLGLIASLGVIVPVLTAIGAYFMRASEAASKSKDSISDLDAGLKSLDETLAKFVQTKKASSMGITVEELLGISGIDSAVTKVEEAKAKLAELQNSNLYSGPLGAFNSFMTGGAYLEAAGIEEIKVAIEAVASAQARLGELRSMQEQERAKAASETIADLDRQSALARLALQYGEESVQYKRMEETFAKAAFVTAQMDKGLRDEALRDVIAAYDVHVAMNKAADDAVKATGDAVKAAEAQRDVLISQVAEQENLLNIEDAKAKKLAESYKAAKGLAEEVKSALDAGKPLSSLNLAKPFESALPAARELVNLMGIALSDAISAINLSTLGQDTGPVGAGRGKSHGAGSTLTPEGNMERILMSLGGERGIPPKVKTKSGGGGSKEDPAQKALEAYRQLVATYDEVEAKTLKVEAARKTLTEAERLGVITSQQSDEALKEYTKTLGDAKSPMLDLANTASQSLSSAFMAIVDGSKSASDAFGDMARAIIKQAFEMAVINPIINSIFGGVKGFSLLPSFFAAGGAFSGGSQIKAYADGGVVGSPTTFPMTGGKTGLMGEAGPEAIMPLKRGANGKLGVQMEGGGSNTTVINQSFNFQANGDESVKRIIAEAAPRIASMTQQSMMDQRRRGGAMKGAFG